MQLLWPNLHFTHVRFLQRLNNKWDFSLLCTRSSLRTGVWEITSFDVIRGSFVFSSNRRFITGMSEHGITPLDIQVRACNEVKGSVQKIICLDLEISTPHFLEEKSTNYKIIIYAINIKSYLCRWCQYLLYNLCNTRRQIKENIRLDRQFSSWDKKLWLSFSRKVLQVNLVNLLSGNILIVGSVNVKLNVFSETEKRYFLQLVLVSRCFIYTSLRIYLNPTLARILKCSLYQENSVLHVSVLQVFFLHFCSYI
jgi:hypothetical protein